jgi:hypothetical protein
VIFMFIKNAFTYISDPNIIFLNIINRLQSV